MAVKGHLISELMVGFSSAPSGKVVIYQTGTSSAANVYSDPDATALISNNGTVATYTLDANGRLEAYVVGVVDVTVKTAADVTVAGPFTPSSSATNTAVSNAGFSATTLDALLTLLYTSFGQTDGRVSVGGTVDYIKNHLSRVSGLFFNVKSSAYGAVGNGTVDDTAAIQSALTAAAAAGGGTVFFPAGSYRVTSQLTVSTNVKLLGSGAIFTSILLDSTTAHLFSSGSTYTIVAEDLRFSVYGATAATGRFFSGALATFYLNRCQVDPGYQASQTLLISCSSLYQTGGTAVVGYSACQYASATSRIVLRDVQIGYHVNLLAAPTATQMFSATTDLVMEGCSFTASPVAGTTPTIVSAAYAFSSGNHFSANGAVVATLFNVGASGILYEAGSFYDTNMVMVTGSASDQNIHCSAPQLEKQVTRTTGVTGAFTPSPLVSGNQIVVMGAGAGVINAPNGRYWGGLRMTLLLYNQSGGNITPTLNAVYKGVTAALIANNNASLFEFIALAPGGGTPNWYCLAKTENFTP